MAIYDISGSVLSTDQTGADMVLTPFPVILTAADFTAHGCTLQASGEVLTVSGNSGGYAALGIPVSDIESQMVRFKATCTVTSGGMKMQLAGTQKNSTTAALLDVATVANSSVDQSIDLAWYDVYSTLDMAKPVELRLTLTAADSGVALTSPVLQKKAFDCGFVEDSGSTLGRALENIQTAVRAASTPAENIYTAPDSSKYLFQVSTAGEIVPVPVVPDKALFIGNSLLAGFGSFGMCASNAQSDYYYHVTQAILAKKPAFAASKAVGTSLESAASDSALDTAYTSNISSKLSADLDLIIVQLSDNTNSEESIAYLTSGGAKRLLSKLRTDCPKARVVWAAAWYYTSEKLEAIRQACVDTGCLFVDISDLRTSENSGKIGNTITYPDGSTSTVEAAGVASHPGDKGMKAIADRLLEKLGIV